jgi:hypothetical protein
MATGQLTTGQGSGTQAATGNPQTITPTNTTALASSVQPGIASSLLRSQGGIPLSSTALPTVSLGSVSQQTQTQPVQPLPAHHINTTYLIAPGLLFVIAIIAFWLTSRSVKSTTDY